ncbi:hypothetical protein NDU88_004419 [Pleurodeles waltl]|uniref:Uncharacterized protein n=1 Tax=Pleurodeles waltl TaxID=8319 RepID=A0AAV7MA13_PLEWA|nr:hypothetical protein NDU88_004419 [Pleurodeles waltl]
MAPKATRTSRTSRGKPNLDPIGGRREKKQPAPLSKEQTSARGRGGQQSALVMEKSARNAAQVLAMFTHTLKSNRTPPQKEVLYEQSGTPGADGDQAFVAGAGARGTTSPKKSGTFLKNTGKEGGFPRSDGKMPDDRMSKEGAKGCGTGRD